MMTTHLKAFRYVNTLQARSNPPPGSFESLDWGARTEQGATFSAAHDKKLSGRSTPSEALGP